ncbi:MAG: beta-ketoacyl-[acyl-carrier-protein] synthase family protein [Pseudomonas sp.]|uniref:beta-ketoacyl-[acyl-carrier-protein] synthase family protein n=1 Tax=Pseudomonas sp. TaxID=306 RepID=UPI00339B10CB
MTVYLNALGLVCALGRGQAAVAEALFAGTGSSLRAVHDSIPGRSLLVGAVQDPLPELPTSWGHNVTRNNRLLLAAALDIAEPVQQAILRFGAARIGVVLGTSTSGIAEASQGIAQFLHQGQLPADYSYRQQELVAPARFLSEWFDLAGPSYAISTACTSSARALLSARRLLEQGLCDAVLCGGVDSLCNLTLNGFAALEAVASERCNPFSRNRQGINIGEAAALFLLTREPTPGRRPIALLGAGASSDAHHISAPDPQGLGAQAAMRAALADAGLGPEQIDYLNLHGTATLHNDSMESLAVQAVFPHPLPCSSSKPMTGHTLGAAGALEAAFCWLSLNDSLGRVPPHLWDGQSDPLCAPLDLVETGRRLPAARHLMSNSFAFGGSNVSLILGVPADPEVAHG